MRFIDPAAARYAVTKGYPNADHTPEYCIKWIAEQLKRKEQGLTHAEATVAIYEEHAKPT